jgi:hypothetical protein
MQLGLVKEVVLRLETARDRRALSTMEESLHQELKLKSLGLASLRHTIAWQESRLLWLKEGDAPTQFFHAHVNAHRRKQFIRSLQQDGQVVTQEEHKADIAFNFFNELLGTPFARTHAVNLHALHLPTLMLPGLDQRFTEQEILMVICSMPQDKVSGLDGFTARFLHQAWDIIRPDIMKVFDAFWHFDTRSFHLLNDALLILLPKKENAATMRDFCLISLIHIIGKLFSKVLASRLAPHQDRLISINQSAFVKGCYIQYNFRLVQSSAKLLHARKKSAVLLKVDIARAFDSVSWPFLLDILKHVGFPTAWLDWIATLLSTANTRMLLNGTPSHRICHARGLCQGDPLSPMLFLLVMEVLNSLIRRADEWNLLQCLGVNMVPFRAAMYADDLIMYAAPSDRDLSMVRTIYGIFEGASKLSCNMAKCQVAPIRCSEEQIQAALASFPYQSTEFPITYLGMSLLVFKLTRSSLQPIADKMVGRLPA